MENSSLTRLQIVVREHKLTGGQAGLIVAFKLLIPFPLAKLVGRLCCGIYLGAFIAHCEGVLWQVASLGFVYIDSETACGIASAFKERRKEGALNKGLAHLEETSLWRASRGCL